MPAQLEQDMGRWLRYQTPLTIAMESVALTGMQHRRGATWAAVKTLRPAQADLGQAPAAAGRRGGIGRAD